MEGNKEDLTKLLLRVQDGKDEPPPVRIESREVLGRVVVATKPCMELGTRIIREKPLLVWTSNDWTEYLDGFLNLSDEEKQLVLDMHCCLSNAKAAAIASLVIFRYPVPADLEKKLIMKLIGIANTNAHAYFGHEANPYRVSFNSAESEPVKSALFAFGSKVSHSCLPNLSYTSKTSDGCLEYKVIRPIQEGDMLTISYIDKLFESPTFVRRELLSDSKAFVCKCYRCMEPDCCRLLKCPKSGCTEYAPCLYSDDLHSNKASWCCSHHGELWGQVALANKEAKWKSKIDFLECMLLNEVERVPPELMKSLLSDIKRDLSPLHYLALRTQALLAKLCVSHAVGIEQLTAIGLLRTNARTPVGTLLGLQLSAAIAGFNYVAACECIAAGCTNRSCRGGLGEATHTPVYECTINLLWAWQDLKAVPNSRWPIYAKPMLRRYVPLLRIHFGENDPDAQDIETAVGALASPPSEVSQAQEDILKSNGTNFRPGSKKKKKTRTNKKKKQQHRRK